MKYEHYLASAIGSGGIKVSEVTRDPQKALEQIFSENPKIETAILKRFHYQLSGQMIADPKFSPRKVFRHEVLTKRFKGII